ncbi:ergothioneine biosynthesis protein EgtB [soil metagenome]
MEKILNAENKLTTSDEKRNYLNNTFIDVRKQTFDLLAPLEIEDYVVQTDAFMSPPRWHIGHTTWFYEQLLKSYYKSFKPFKEDFAFYFNSYYLTYGKLFNKSKRGTISRPTVRETLEYCKWINNQVLNFFKDDNSEITDEVYSNFELGYNHEWQHQELIVYDLQHLLQDNYSPEIQISGGKYDNKSVLKNEMIRIPGGIYEMGFDPDQNKNIFSYDVERPKHKVYLNDFLIAKYPVSNNDFLDFINDGGYKNFKYWLSEGWDTRNYNEWEAPMYWFKNDTGNWYKHDFRGVYNIEERGNEPVTNISYFEASAYAKWAGKRLPSEAEWEKAAAFDEKKNEIRLFPWGNNSPSDKKTNLLGFGFWGTTIPANFEEGKSSYGLYGMIGDTWEWTTSEFMPYPGFKSSFDEYNDKWFCNQKVLRGGSFGTPYLSTRNTYRNFFRTNERWLISGFRCAKDVD